MAKRKNQKTRNQKILDRLTGRYQKQEQKKEELQQVAAWANQNIRRILSELGIRFQEASNYLSTSCFIHGGDNPNAFCWYWDLPNKPNGYWECFTHACQEGVSNDIFGLLQAYYKCGRAEAIKKALEFYQNMDGKSSIILPVTKLDTSPTRKRSAVKDCYAHLLKYNNIKMAAKMLEDRGYLEYLSVYGVMYCTDPIHILRNRLIFPTKDKDGEIIGFTGRADNNRDKPKWRHHLFKVERHLFNIFFAQSFVRQTKTAILVEGPFEILKCVKIGYKNVLGLLRADLTAGQKSILMGLGVNKIIALQDHDEAGLRGAKKTEKMLNSQGRGYFEFHNLSEKLPSGKDADKVTDEDLRKLLGAII